MKFKSTVLATTALVVIAATTAQAGQYMGKMNLGLGNAWEDYNFGGEFDQDLNYTTLHGSASVNVPYSDRVNLQFDIFGNQSLDEAFGGEGDNGSFYGGFGAGIHLNYKDPSEGAIGVFGAVGRAAVAGTYSSDGAVFAAGLEGEYYCNAWTLSAQIGYLDTDDTIFGLVKNAGFARAGVAFYASNKLKLSGSVGYLNGDTGNYVSDGDFDQWNWSLGAEYLFGKSVPVSTYVEYRGLNNEVGFDFTSTREDEDRHEVRAGVRFYFGAGDDLMKADREGASFESPDLVTWPRFRAPAP